MHETSKFSTMELTDFNDLVILVFFKVCIFFLEIIIILFQLNVVLGFWGTLTLIVQVSLVKLH